MAQLSQPEIVYLIIVCSLGMLLLAGGISYFIILFQKRVIEDHKRQLETDKAYAQNMIEAQLESQELERKRIAADLHDSLGSLLWGAKVNASFIQRTMIPSEDVKDSLSDLIEILDQGIHTVRRISWELTPEAFHHSGFSKSIFNLCKQFDGRVISVEFIETGYHEWNDELALQAFRIIQELISNAIKHSKASELKVTLVWEAGAVVVEVLDNGIGFNLDNNRRGVGWWNIEQRAKKLNANINIGVPPIGSGAKILIKIPLADEAK